MVFRPSWTTSWVQSVSEREACMQHFHMHAKLLACLYYPILPHIYFINYYYCSEGKDWKRQRVAASKQALPRNVNSYIEGLNPIYTRFSDHLRKIRSEDGLIKDFTYLSRKITMEGIRDEST